MKFEGRDQKRIEEKFERGVNMFFNMFFPMVYYGKFQISIRETSIMKTMYLCAHHPT